jgi:SAM-dependent methyltransferase
MILSPRRPTRERMRVLSASKYSVLRTMEHEIIPAIPLKGRTLDVGGGANSSYNPLMRCDGKIESLNIDPDRKPDHLADANTRFPLDDNSFDNVVSFNTLEHIHDDMFALSEMIRVLRPGGSFHIIVPFIFPVHGKSEFDHNRHTAHFWDARLGVMGIPDEKRQIEPLVWGPVVTAVSMLERFRFVRRLRPLFLYGTLLRLRKEPMTERLSGDIAWTYSRYAMGYYISGVKPS